MNLAPRWLPSLVLALLAACPDAEVAPPEPEATKAPPAEVTRWLSCASELGFELQRAGVAAPGTGRALIRPPAIHVLAAAPADDADARTLRWFTPIPTGASRRIGRGAAPSAAVPGPARRGEPGTPAPGYDPRPAAVGTAWDVGLSLGDGTLQLDVFTPGSFLDAQRLLVVERRCGALVPGQALRAAFASGAPEDVATRGAARLVIAACGAGQDASERPLGAGPSCPDGWRERLLALAAVHPNAAPPRFERDCSAPAPPEPGHGGSAARQLARWVVDELGPAPGTSVVAWARQLSALALGGGEGLIRRRFDALVDAGDAAGAARLVAEAAASDLGISERLRFDGALAWRTAGDLDAARAALRQLADAGRTAYAAFARQELGKLPR